MRPALRAAAWLPSCHSGPPPFFLEVKLKNSLSTQENQRESKKPAGERFSSNSDSIGIELVGMSYKAKSHQETSNLDGSFNFSVTTEEGTILEYKNLSAEVASQMRDEIEKNKSIDKYLLFEQVTDKQNESIQWLIQQLCSEYSVLESEVFAHPAVSYKTGSEALTAQWK